MTIDLSVPIWTIEHVAAALSLSVDTARTHAASAGFPAPRAGFTRNLWPREAVLAWFAALPAKAASEAGQAATAAITTPGTLRTTSTTGVASGAAHGAGAGPPAGRPTGPALGGRPAGPASAPAAGATGAGRRREYRPRGRR